MPNINDAFPSKFLKASDLKGTEPVCVIDKVLFEPVGQSKEMKAVVYFVGKAKGLVLNKTNATRIVQLSGSGITEEWPGTRIKLYGSVTTFEGDEVECIRIRQNTGALPKAPPALPPPPPPPADMDTFSGPVDADEIPF